jgi:hypothetical protein
LAFVDFGVPIPPAVIDLDWFVPETPVFRPPHRVRPGLSTLGEPPTIPAFDWWHQQADVIHPPHQARPGWFSLVEFTIPVPEDFDWFQQEPEPLPRPTRPEGLLALVEFAVPVSEDFDWFQQGPDVIRPQHQVRPGLSALGEPPIVLPFDWFQQQPGPLRKPVILHTGEVRVDVVVVGPLPDFGWFIQQADVMRPPRQVRTGLFIIGEPPAIPAFDWLPSMPDVMLSLHLVRLGILAQPTLVIAAPVPDLVYIIQVCFGLDELERNRLLPQGSGFIWTEDELTPSGWESDPDGTTLSDLMN